MNKRQKKALKESIVIVGAGFVINWPISFFLLYWFIDVLDLSSLTVSILLTGCITLIALIRVFVIRMWFSTLDTEI
jgi:hypothetical protein